jgi:large subunit ribosomal protein L23
MNQEQLLRVIKSPCVTEKGTLQQTMNNQYLLEVIKNATKSQIKQAVETLFKVKVLKVNTLNTHAGTKRVGKVERRIRSWKKAYVTLEKGQRIPLFSIE